MTNSYEIGRGEDMLVLCSNGLSSKEILAYTRGKVCNCKTAALVVTADNEYKENNYHVARCVSELESLNLKVDIFDLDKQSAELLLEYDVVEFYHRFKKDIPVMRYKFEKVIVDKIGIYPDDYYIILFSKLDN